MTDQIWRGLAEQTTLDSDYFAESNQIGRLIAEQDSQVDWSRQYFDEYGNTTYSRPQAPGFWGTVYSRLNRGSGQLGDAVYAKSIGQMYLDLFDRKVKPPGRINSGNVMLDDGTAVPVDEATATQMWDTMSVGEQSIYQAAGLTRERVIREVEDDPFEFMRYHAEFVEMQHHQHRLDQYAEEHGLMYTAAGLVAGTVDIATDPLNVVTFGAAAVAKTAGKVAATKAGQVIARIAGKSGSQSAIGQRVRQQVSRFHNSLRANGSPVYSVLESVSPIQREWAGRVLVGSIVAENVGMDIASQYAEHETGVRYGLLEEDEEFSLSLSRVAVTGMVSMALGSLAAVSMGMRPYKFTAREVVAHSQGTRTSEYLMDMMAKGHIAPDDMLDRRLVSNLEGMESVMRVSYTPQQFDEINLALDKSILTDTPQGLDHLSKYVAGRPNKREISEFIAKYDGPEGAKQLAKDVKANRVLDTEYSRAWNTRESVRLEYEAALKSGSRDEIAKTKSKLTRAQNKLNAARDRFDLDLNRIKDSDPIQEWAEAAVAPAVVSATDPAAIRTRRARFLGQRYVNNPRNVVKRHTPKVEQMLGALSLGISSVSKANKMFRKNTGFGRLSMALRAGLDDTAMRGYAVDSNGQAVQSAWKRMSRLRADRTELNRLLQSKLGKLNNSKNKTAEELGDEVLSALALGRKLEDPELQDIANGVSDYFSRMGERGVRAGHFASLTDNFLPVRILRDVAIKHKAVLTEKLKAHFGDRYGLNSIDPRTGVGDANSLLYRKLIPEIADKEEQDFLSALIGELKPTESLSVSDLSQEAQGRYWQNLDRAMQTEAEQAINRRLSDGVRATTNKQKVADLRADKWADERGTRRIEQEFWYRDDVRKIDGDAILDTNINHLTSQYENSTGFRIALQETMTEMFGEPITFDDMLGELRKLADTPEEIEVAENLSKLMEIASGTYRTTNKSNTLELLSSLTRSVTYGSVPLMILGTEGSVAMARAIGSGNIKTMFRVPKQFLTRLSEDEMRVAGFALDYEWDNSRIFGIVEDITSGDSQHIALGWAHGLERFARKFGGEAYVTRRLKMLHFMQSSGVLYKSRNKLDRLSEINTTLDLSDSAQRKIFAGQARKAGLRVDHAELLVRNNVLTKETIAAAKEFQRIDSDSLANVLKMQDVLDQIPEQHQAGARKLIDRVTNHATYDAESFITTPTPNTVFRSDNALANAFSMYTSFPLAFMLRTMSRVGQAPAHRQFGFLATYMMGEMVSSSLRRVMYNDETVDEVIQDWEDNPEQNFVNLALRLPVFGPWNVGPELVAGAFGQTPGWSTGGSAALGSTLNMGRKAIAAAKDIVTGDVENIGGSLEDLSNVTPMLNSWWARIPARFSAFGPEDQEYFDSFFSPFENDYSPEFVPWGEVRTPEQAPQLETAPTDLPESVDLEPQPIVQPKVSTSDALDLLSGDADVQN